MERAYTGHIVPAEWRWVISASIILLFVIFVPFLLLVVIKPPDHEWQFLGALHDFRDASVSLTRIRQGMEGLILVPSLYTPEANPGVLIQPVYMLLGHLARITSLSPVLMFHLARVFSALFMFLTLYQLAASIWVKIRARRIFFVVAVSGSGLGWLYGLFVGFGQGLTVPELQYPMIYPLFSSAVNVHYPLTIACLSLIVSHLIPVLRPGESDDPRVDNGGLAVFMTGLILALLFPDALLPIAIAYGVSTIALWLGRRRIGSREFYWGLWILAPALPVLTYDLLVLQGNPIVYSWVMQRSDSTASFPMLLLAAAIPLLLAVPGLWRALRYFEPDGDRFMLVWLVAMVVVAYFPVPLRQFALVGMMLPIAYFTTRSIEDFWFSYVRRRYRNLLYAFGIALMSVGHVIWLFMPVVPIVQKWVQHDGNVLSQDYTDALTWLDSQVDSSDVVLAAPAVSVWIPFRTGARVVFGHPIETDQAAERLQELVQWYAISDPERCNDLIDRYQVDVVVYGSHERRYGEARCLQNLVSVAAFGDVEIYATTYLLSNQP